MSTSQTHVLLVCGPAGVGKSTLGYEIVTQLREAGVAHVLLDSDELDRVWPLSRSDQDALNQANLAAFWATASALGHDHLILVGGFLDPDAERIWIDPAIPDAKVPPRTMPEPEIGHFAEGTALDQVLLGLARRCKRFGKSRRQGRFGFVARHRPRFWLDGLVMGWLGEQSVANPSYPSNATR